MKIALIDYGEVGRILAEDLRARGEAVTAYDLKLDRDETAAPPRERTQRHGVAHP